MLAKVIVLMAAIMVLALATVAPAAVVPPPQNIISPIGGTIWDPCAAEWVDFSGEVHNLVQTMQNDKFFMVKTHSNFMNVVGIGQQSRQIYQIPGTNNSTILVDAQLETPRVSTDLTCGRLASNNANLTMRVHTTVTPNGDVTVDYEIVEITCTGRTVGQEPVLPPPTIIE